MNTPGPEYRARRRCFKVVCHQHCLVQQKVEKQGLVITVTNINQIRCRDGVCDIVYDIIYDI